MALYKPANTFEGVCAKLRSAIGTAMRTQEQQQFNADTPEHEQNWTDRVYGGRGRGSRDLGSRDFRNFRGNSQGNGFRGGRARGRYNSSAIRQKKCYVCGKIGCWSTKHPIDTRKKAYDKFNQSATRKHLEPSVAYYQSFLSEFEGIEGLTDDVDDEMNETEQLLMDIELGDNKYDFDTYITKLREVNGLATVAILNDHSVFYSITKSNIFYIPTRL